MHILSRVGHPLPLKVVTSYAATAEKSSGIAVPLVEELLPSSLARH